MPSLLYLVCMQGQCSVESHWNSTTAHLRQLEVQHAKLDALAAEVAQLCLCVCINASPPGRAVMQQLLLA